MKKQSRFSKFENFVSMSLIYFLVTGIWAILGIGFGFYVYKNFMIDGSFLVRLMVSFGSALLGGLIILAINFLVIRANENFFSFLRKISGRKTLKEEEEEEEEERSVLEVVEEQYERRQKWFNNKSLPEQQTVIWNIFTQQQESIKNIRREVTYLMIGIIVIIQILFWHVI
jgi:hypothetical protein